MATAVSFTPGSSTVSTASIVAAAVTEAKLDTASSNVLNVARTGKWTYTFATQGGTQAALPLTGAALPAKAVVIGGVARVSTAITGGAGCTAALSCEGAGDLVIATVVAGAPWSTTGRKAVIPAFTAATSIETTQARTPSITFAVNDATAGAFELWLTYYLAA